MKIAVIDNFLDPSSFKQLQALMVAESWFPWYFNPCITDNEDDDRPHYFQFTHTFYRDNCPQSEHFNALMPLLAKLGQPLLVRVKANLLTRTEAVMEHDFHTDAPELEPVGRFQTAVFYLNSNDGRTVFEDGTRVESRANRIAIFDSRLRHGGSTCTDQKTRVVLNLNYFGGLAAE